MKNLKIKNLDDKINNLMVYDYDIIDIDNYDNRIVINGIDFVLTIYKKINGFNSFLKQGREPDKAQDIINYLLE